MVLGGKHVETPYIELGQICTFIYFAFFFLLIPGLSLFENVITSLKSFPAKGLGKESVGGSFKPLYFKGLLVIKRAGSFWHSIVFKRNISSNSSSISSLNGEISEEKIGEPSKAVLIGKEGETLTTLEEARNYFQNKKAAYNPRIRKRIPRGI
jgi:hypothetical protein